MNSYRIPSRNFSPFLKFLKIRSTECINMGGLDFEHLRVNLLNNVRVKIYGSTCLIFCATNVQNFENGREIVRGNMVNEDSQIT